MFNDKYCLTQAVLEKIENHPNLKDITGKTYNSLTALRKHHKDSLNKWHGSVNANVGI